MNILITGGGGVIGSCLTKYLSAKHNVFDLSISPDVHLQFDLLKILDNEITNVLLGKKIDIIIHCAAKIETATLEDFYLNSFALNKFFINEIGKKKRYIVIGSAAEYGAAGRSGLINENTFPAPSSFYGSSKLLQTTLCHYYFNLGLDVQVLRLFNIIAPTLPNRTFIGSLLEEVKKGKEGRVKISNLKIERDFLDLRDFCNLLSAMIDCPAKSFLYNIATGQNITYEFFLNKVAAILKQYNLSCPEVLVSDKEEVFDTALCDTSKLANDYSWRPFYNLQDSILWCLKEIKLI